MRHCAFDTQCPMVVRVFMESLREKSPLACRGSLGQKAGGAAAEQPFKFNEDLRIPPSLGYFLLHGLQGFIHGKSTLVGAFGSQRVIHVDNREDSGSDWDGVSTQSVGISRAVKFFVVVADDGEHGAERFQWGADALAHYGVFFHQCPLFCGEFGGLQKYGVGHGNSADVVDDTGAAQSDDLLFWEA